MKVSAEQQIAEAVELYADFHGVPTASVDVTREFEGDGDIVTRFRLSMDQEGRSRGCDEWYEVAR